MADLKELFKTLVVKINSDIGHKMTNISDQTGISVNIIRNAYHDRPFSVSQYDIDSIYKAYPELNPNYQPPEPTLDNKTQEELTQEVIALLKENNKMLKDFMEEMPKLMKALRESGNQQYVDTLFKLLEKQLDDGEEG